MRILGFRNWIVALIKRTGQRFAERATAARPEPPAHAGEGPPPAVTGTAGGHSFTGDRLTDSEVVDEASEESFPASDPPAYR